LKLKTHKRDKISCFAGPNRIKFSFSRNIVCFFVQSAIIEVFVQLFVQRFDFLGLVIRNLGFRRKQAQKRYLVVFHLFSEKNLRVNHDVEPGFKSRKSNDLVILFNNFVDIFAKYLKILTLEVHVERLLKKILRKMNFVEL
jgi:hypothetical protein